MARLKKTLTLFPALPGAPVLGTAGADTLTGSNGTDDLRGGGGTEAAPIARKIIMSLLDK